MRICIKKITWSVPPELVKTEKQKKKLLQMFSAHVVERRVSEDKIPKPTAPLPVRIHTCVPDPEKGGNCSESETLTQIKASTKIKNPSAPPAVKIHTRVSDPEKWGSYSETLTHIKVSAAAHKPRNGDYVFPLGTEANKVKLIDVGIMPQVMHPKAYEAVVEHLRSKTSLSTSTPVAKKVKQTPTTPKKKRQGKPVKRAKIEVKTEKSELAETEQIASFKILPATTPCSIRLTRIKIPVITKTGSPVEPAPAAAPSETDQAEIVQVQEQELIKD